MANPNDELDLSHLLPLHDDNRATDENLVSLFEEQHGVLSNHQYIEQHHEQYQATDPMEKEIVSITEDDILNILGRTEIVTDTSVDSILPIGDGNTGMGVGVTTDIVSGLLDSSNSTTVSNNTFVQPEECRVQASSQVVHMEPRFSVQNVPNLPKVSQTITDHPTSDAVRVLAAPNPEAKPLGSVPFKINLPPGLPAGRYILKHSVTDPSTVELSFPDTPGYKPISLPIVSQAPMVAPTPIPSNTTTKAPSICFSVQENVEANKTPTTLAQYNVPVVNQNTLGSIPTVAMSQPLSVQIIQNQEPFFTLKQKQNDTAAIEDPKQCNLPVTEKSVLPVVQLSPAPSDVTQEVNYVGTHVKNKPVYIIQNPPQPSTISPKPNEVNSKRPTDIVETMQVVNTSSGPQRKTIMTLNNRNWQQVPQALQHINKHLINIQVPPAQIIKQPGGLFPVSVGAPTTSSLGPPQTCIISKPLNGNIPHVASLGSIISPNTQGSIFSGPGSNIRPMTLGPSSLAPISGLLNFAQLKGIPGIHIKNIAGDHVDFGSVSPKRTGLASYEARPVVPRSQLSQRPSPLCSDTEGLTSSPKSLLFKNITEPAELEVVDGISLVPSLPPRGRTGKCNHTMVVVPIRDECVSFLNDAHSLHHVYATINRMKLVARYMERTSENQPNHSNQVSGEKEGLVDGDETYTANSENSDLHQPDHNLNTSTAIKTADTTYSVASEKESESQRADTDCDNSEAHYRGRKIAYKTMQKEQECRRLERKCKLDSLIEEGSRSSALAKLYLGAPRMVEDPLEGDSGNPMYYCCYLCPFASYNESKVSVHWTIKHLQQNPYICAYCPAQFAASGKAQRHIELAHPKMKPVVKLVPSEHFTNSIQFEFIDCRDSKSKVLPLIYNSPCDHLVKPDEWFICKACGARSSEENNITEHIRTKHMDLKPYSCKACSESFKSPPSADTHSCCDGNKVSYSIDKQLLQLSQKLLIKDFYSRVPYNWPAKFVPETEYWLAMQKPTDSGAVRLLCRFCTFESPSSISIWKHVREEHHLPLGAFCNRCSAYRRLTSKEREHEFSVCCRCCALTSLQFSDDDVNNNVQSITLLQVFRCIKCPEKSRDVSAVRRHVREHHIDVQPYFCNQCRQTFSSRQTAQQHGRQYHGTSGCIEKDVSLMDQVTELVKKSIVKYMYPEPKDGTNRLSSLWKAHGKRVIDEMGELQRQYSTRQEEGGNEEVDDGDGEEKSEADDGYGLKRPHKSLPPGVRRIQAEPYESFEGRNHYRCLICQYKCTDRSCMSRHVKYMHLRIHPHSCPYCGYSNVEKTKVKLHILNLHNQSSKKVKTNITLVTALGEESKKHFVRITPEGTEVSQTEATNKASYAASSRSTDVVSSDARQDPSPNDDDGFSPSRMTLEPLRGAELYGLDEDDVDDEHVRQFQLDLKALEASPVPGLLVRNHNVSHNGDVLIKDEPLGSDDETNALHGEVVRIKRTSEDMDIDLGPDGTFDFREVPAPKRRKTTTKTYARSVEKPNKHALKIQTEKRCSKSRIYMDQRVQYDFKLTAVPVVVMEDIVAKVLSGK